MPETPLTPEPLHACAVVLPALVDHPGNVAWQRAFELAHATGAVLHVLHPLDADVEREQDRERALVAAERGLEQWVRGRTLGTSVAERVTIHLTWQSDTLGALNALVRDAGVEAIVIGAADDLRATVASLLEEMPCSLLVATERTLEGSRARETHASQLQTADRDESGESEILLRSAPLAMLAPMPDPSVVSDAVG